MLCRDLSGRAFGCFGRCLRQGGYPPERMRSRGLVPLGNWHSHPESPARPSEEDKRLANDSRASYLILSLEDDTNPVLHAFHVEGVDGQKTVHKEELEILE